MRRARTPKFQLSGPTVTVHSLYCDYTLIKIHDSQPFSIYQKQVSPAVEDSEPQDAGNATVYVSGLKESTTTDTVTLFFENKKRSGGGKLCEGKEGYKRISNTVARLTFVSSKGNWIKCIICQAPP